MKVIQLTEFGGPEVLKYTESDKPSPDKHEVLIKVSAAGVNYADTMRRQNKYLVETPLPFVPGSEVVGEVVETGSEVPKDVSVGSRVVALIGEGAYAEYAVANVRSLIPIPETLSDHEAVALPLQGLSAYHIIKTMGRLEHGETILIHAAAGGVGTLAVQLAKHFGAGSIIATASTEEKRNLALEMGADHAVDYTKDEWVQEVLDLTDGKGADVALEMVGGKIFDQTLECLAPFGRLVFYGAASGEIPQLSPFDLMKENQAVIGFFLTQMMAKPELIQESLQEIISLAAANKLQLTVGGVYKLENAAQLHEDMENRRTSGKLVLEP